MFSFVKIIKSHFLIGRLKTWRCGVTKRLYQLEQIGYYGLEDDYL